MLQECGCVCVYVCVCRRRVEVWGVSLTDIILIGKSSFCKSMQAWPRLIQQPFCATSPAHAHSHIFVDNKDSSIILKSTRFNRIKPLNCHVPIWWCLSGPRLCLPLKVIPCWQMMVKGHCYVIAFRLAQGQVCWFLQDYKITNLTIYLCVSLHLSAYV